MKKIILWKSYNPDRLFGGYQWHIDEVYNDWDHIYSEPYEVEILENFEVGVTVAFEKMFFKRGCDKGYYLVIGQNCENGNPYLVGGDPVEKIKLKVIRRME